MKARFVLAGVLLAITVGLVAPASALSYQHVTVSDLSWPNCKTPLQSAFPPGIIGVNGGLDFHPNPCLQAETQLMHANYALYLNTGYPGSASKRSFSTYPEACGAGDNLCLAYNYGYNAALYSIAYADNQMAHSNVWWLDVETANSWTTNVLQNQVALTGMVDALQQHTFWPIIGVYSFPGQWQSITGSWRSGMPAWVATGTTSYGSAVAGCRGGSFTGGRIWLSQYTTTLDHNYLCNTSYSQAFRF